MKNLFFITLGLLLLSSCNERKVVVSGKLTVNQKVTFVDMGSKEQTYEEGKYTTRLRIPNKDTFKFSIDQDGRPSLGFFFNFPKNTDLPQNGEIEMNSEELGQPYQAIGEISTEQEEGEYREAYRSCWYDRWEPVCHRTPTGTYCSTQRRAYYGQEMIGYYNLNTTRTFVISFYGVDVDMDTDDAKAAAVFNGKHKSSKKIIEYVGPCF